MSQFSLEQFLFSLAYSDDTVFTESLNNSTFPSPVAIYNLPYFLENTANITRYNFKFSIMVEVFLSCCDEFSIRQLPNLRASIASGVSSNIQLVNFLTELRKRLQSHYVKTCMEQESNAANYDLEYFRNRAATILNKYQTPVITSIRLSFTHENDLDVMDVIKYVAQLCNKIEGLADCIAKITFDFTFGFYVDVFIFSEPDDELMRDICECWFEAAPSWGNINSVTEMSNIDFYAKLEHLCHFNKQFTLTSESGLWFVSGK
jgi:hypothetical protein